ncbi:hypothetical protein [Streptomyces sp. NPDC003720]
MIQKIAALAADTLRLEARELWACDGAEHLSNGTPRIGGVSGGSSWKT